MSVLNKTVSYFPSITATSTGADVNLLKLLQSDKHRDIITYLRGCDEAEQKRIKNTLPCYTVAGTFNNRSESGLITLSGLACVDLDSAEDYDIASLIRELKKIDSIAYAGLSCRGARLFCIVPFLYPDKYAKQYERLIKSFEDMGLPMGDNCHKQISQPRFISWNDDSTQFFRNDAKPYPLLPIERTYHIPKSNSYQYSRTITPPENAFQWCVEQINKSHSFSDGSRHEYMMHLVRYCNLKGLEEHETLSGCKDFIQADFLEKEIADIVRHVYEKHKDSHAKHPFKVYAPKNTTRFSERQQTEEIESLTNSDILDINQAINDYEVSRTLDNRCPREIREFYCKLMDNPKDGNSYRKIFQFITNN